MSVKGLDHRSEQFAAYCENLPCYSQKFIGANDLASLIDIADSELHKGSSKPEASSLSLEAPQVELDLETLICRMERLEKALPHVAPKADFMQTLNALEVEGFLPPLLCLLFKKMGGFLETVAGRQIFTRLAAMALELYAQDKNLGLASADIEHLRALAKESPQKFLDFLYFCKMQTTSSAAPIWAVHFKDEEFDVKSANKRLEVTSARHFLLMHVDKEISPAFKNDSLVKKHLANFAKSLEHSPEIFKAELITLLGLLEKKSENYIQRLYFKDLAKKVEEIGKDENPIVAVAHMLKAQQLYKHVAQESSVFSEEMLRQLNDADVHTFEKLKQIATKGYHLSILFLKDRKNLTFASETESSRELGLMTRNFRKIDDRFSELLGHPLHHFCGCHLISHVKEEAAGKELSKGWPTLDGAHKPLVVSPEPKPQHAGLKGRSVFTLSCRLGGAHDVVQDTFTKRYAEEGMHVYNVDGIEEVLSSLDLLVNLNKKLPSLLPWLGRRLGCDVSSLPTFVGSLMRQNAWKTLDFLREQFAGDATDDFIEEQVSLFTRAMLQRDPDLVMSSYTRNSGTIAEAARRTGLGVYNSATDFDPELVDITPATGAPKNKLFRHALFTDQAAGVKEFLQGRVKEEPSGRFDAFDVFESEHTMPLLTDEQVVVGGFPIRAPFFKKYSETEMQALRVKHDVKPGEQVVVIIAGGFGVQNNYAKIIADQYRTSSTALPKVRLFALCGKNKAELARLEKELGTFSHESLRLSLLGEQTGEEVAELFSLAADTDKETGLEGLVLSAKSGGGTIAEAAARNVRILANNRCPFVWEKYNLQVVSDAGLGEAFEKDEEVFSKMKELLKTPKNPKVRFDQMDSVGLSMGLSADLLVKAQKDAEFATARRVASL